MKSGRFHDLYEIWRISWQGLIYTAYLACNRLIHVYLYWFWWKIQHSVVDHEIWWISSWNPVDFMPRTYTLHLYLYCPIVCIPNEPKIQHSVVDHERPWNPPDFMPRTYTLHLYLYWISWMKKIQHSVVDHEIWQISCMKSSQFHAKDLHITFMSVLDLMNEKGLIYTAYLACNRLIHVYLYWFWWKIQHSVVDHEISAYLMYICIGSEEKSTIHEIQQISWWNLADFMPRTYAVYKMYICVGSDEKYSIQW